MKIQCDVCTKEASVFCCADEAALCTPCDRRVHLANKLASKHRRFSLILPSSSSPTHPHPLCDICQKKQALVFCQQDRAILCKDCDASIHTANNLTMKHSRFILTGARLSAAPIPPSSPPPELDEPEKHNTSSNTTTGSSISEYLIEMLPGWRVEDILVDDAAAVAATAATTNIHKKDVFLPFLEADQEGRGPDTAAVEDFSTIWVPHMPQFNPQCSAAMTCHHPVLLGMTEMDERNSWSDDHGFTVPDSNPSLGSNKRPRPSFWHF